MDDPSEFPIRVVFTVAVEDAHRHVSRADVDDPQLPVDGFTHPLQDGLDLFAGDVFG